MTDVPGTSQHECFYKIINQRLWISYYLTLSITFSEEVVISDKHHA